MAAGMGFAQTRRRALSRAEQGKALSLDEVEALLLARDADLERAMSSARHLRDLGWGNTVTYSRKVFIPLTMLCRDHCHYCTFAKPPAKLEHPYLSLEEVVAIAEAGRALGCKEALFTLGDRPEERYPVARAWLMDRGYRTTLEYVRAAAVRVLEETGLLPHLNPGVMSYEELARLKHVSASMGLMLETSSDRLSGKGGPHAGSPDKVPSVRLRTIEDAGRLAIPFTTGILVGIGETPRERGESLFAIRDLHRRYRHVQEVIVQNFRAKAGTAMRHAPEPQEEEFLAAVATARLVLGPHVSIQAPPNLSDPEQRLRLLDAGINDWGGVSPLTPDHVNPERPWPTVDALAATTAARGKRLRERLAIYPSYAARPGPMDRGQDACTGVGAARRGWARGRRAATRTDPVAGPRGLVASSDDRLDLREAPGRGAPGGRRGRLRGAGCPRERGHPGLVGRARRPGTVGYRRPLGAREGRRAPPHHRCGGPRLVPRRGTGARRAVPGRRRAPRRGRRSRGDLRRQPEHQLHERLLRGMPVLRVRAARGRPGVVHAHA